MPISALAGDGSMIRLSITGSKTTLVALGSPGESLGRRRTVHRDELAIKKNTLSDRNS